MPRNMDEKTPEIGIVPDYTEMTISREEILEDMGRRAEQADRVVELGHALKQNLYAAAKKVGITKEEINRAKFLRTARDLGGDLLREIDPEDLDRDNNRGSLQ